MDFIFVQGVRFRGTRLRKVLTGESCRDIVLNEVHTDRPIQCSAQEIVHVVYSAPAWFTVSPFPNRDGSNDVGFFQHFNFQVAELWS
jgi:hypothetical protein